MVQTPAPRRTAAVPGALWDKNGSDRYGDNVTKAEREGKPFCVVCGRGLDVNKAVTVAIIDGGSNFLHPDDVTDADREDGGYMGLWDLGSSCVRLAPARVRGAYVPLADKN